MLASILKHSGGRAYFSFMVSMLLIILFYRGIARLEKLYQIPVSTMLLDLETAAELARNLELSAAKLRRVFLFLEEGRI